MKNLKFLTFIIVMTILALGVTGLHAERGLAGLSDYVPPEDSGWINVKSLGVKGDGVTDDTEAFKTFKPANPHSVGTLYFPNGTYLLSDTLYLGNKRVILQGESRDGVVLRLKENSAGFGDRSKPKPFLSTHSLFMDSKSNWGQAFKNSAYNMTIEVSPGNPGAVAFHYLSNNQGTIENVTMRGEGRAGLGLVTNWPGPSLIRNVLIEGFDFGVWSLIAQYSMTFENLTLRGQKEFGVFNQGQALFFRRLKSENTVPAIRNTRPTTNLVVIDSELTGGSGGAAIDSSEMAKSDRYTFQHVIPGIFLRQVKTSGYGQALSYNAKGKLETLPVGVVDELSSIEPAKLFSEAKQSLNLPVEEAPTLDLGSSSSWVSIKKFPPTPVQVGNKTAQDWGPALQAAVDSGAEVIYFPRAEYPLLSPVILRGKLKALMGMDSTLSTSDWTQGDTPVLSIVSNNQPVLLLDRINDNYGKAPLMYDLAANKTVILKNSLSGRFRNSVPGGKLFLYDVCGSRFEFKDMSVWARQFNPEAGKSPNAFNVRISGGSFWALGIKTEYGQTVIHAKDGAKVEVLGGWHYHDGIVGYINENSQMSIAGLLTSSGNFNEALIREIRSGQTTDFKIPTGRKQSDGYGGGYRQYGTLVPLYLGN
jgi:Pectate lyase superfamily protein